MIWIILVLGLILRVISLNQSLWLDEATSATVVKNFSFGDILTKFSPGDFHPSFYYLALKAWSIPFGVSEISLRMLSILFALGTIYLIYAMAKKFKTEAFATSVAILLATSPLFVYYSQEARMYVMETFLVTLSVYSFMNLFKNGKLVWWIVFSASLALIGATDYLPILVIPVFWMYSLLKKKDISFFSKLTLAHLPLAGFFAYWAPTLIKQLNAGLSVQSINPGWWKVLGGSNLKEAALLPVKFIIGRISFDNKIVYALVLIPVLALFGYLIFKSIKVLKKNSLTFYWLIIPVLLAFMLGLKLSVFSYFRLLFVLPAFYMVVVLGLYQAKKKYFPILFMALILVNMIFSLTYLLNTKFQREDWRGAVSQIDGSPVVFPASSQREAFLYYNPKPNIIEPENLNKTIEAKDLYLMRYVADIFDPEDTVRKKIEDLGYKKDQEYNFNGVVVWKYQK